jgi:hypothetical protein
MQAALSKEAEPDARGNAWSTAPCDTCCRWPNLRLASKKSGPCRKLFSPGNGLTRMDGGASAKLTPARRTSSRPCAALIMHSAFSPNRTATSTSRKDEALRRTMWVPRVSDGRRVAQVSVDKVLSWPIHYRRRKRGSRAGNHLVSERRTGMQQRIPAPLPDYGAGIGSIDRKRCIVIR